MSPAGLGLAGFLRRFRERLGKDPRLTARLVLGVLLAANLAAAAALLRPWGGSPEQLQRQLADMRREASQREATVRRLGALVETVVKTRAGSDQFFANYFLSRQAAYSTVLAELNALADKSGVKPKDHSFSEEPIEGSDTLAMLIITGNYEGSYADLVEFVNAIDRSQRFLTIERLQAAPIQSQGALNINLRISAFVRGEAAAQ
ncbi:MAG TPA: type 4a pilus biogenesis protein PilO [Bryobacteraceae bacterium]|nr:type 4a pilus biogenesis protein PilO [Bryobacteraceae bacterium]